MNSMIGSAARRIWSLKSVATSAGHVVTALRTDRGSHAYSWHVFEWALQIAKSSITEPAQAGLGAEPDKAEVGTVHQLYLKHGWGVSDDAAMQLLVFN